MYKLVSCLIIFLFFVDLFCQYKIVHSQVGLQPRGLMNRGNWCYINAVSFFMFIYQSVTMVTQLLFCLIRHCGSFSHV